MYSPAIYLLISPVNSATLNFRTNQSSTSTSAGSPGGDYPDTPVQRFCWIFLVSICSHGFYKLHFPALMFLLSYFTLCFNFQVCLGIRYQWGCPCNLGLLSDRWQAHSGLHFVSYSLLAIDFLRLGSSDEIYCLSLEPDRPAHRNTLLVSVHIHSCSLQHPTDNRSLTHKDTAC